MAITQWLSALTKSFRWKRPNGAWLASHRRGQSGGCGSCQPVVWRSMERFEARTMLSGVPVLIDILAGAGVSNPTSLTDVDGTLFFAADGGQGRELWSSDGTAAGTVRVADIHAGPAGSSPASLTNVDGTLFFTADDGGTDKGLWKTDGTAMGTVNVLPNSGDLELLTNVDGTLFFTPGGFTSGPLSVSSTIFTTSRTPYSGLTFSSIWSSDGTAAGTGPVVDGVSFAPTEMVDLNGVLFLDTNELSDSTQLTSNVGRELFKLERFGFGGHFRSLLRDINSSLVTVEPPRDNFDSDPNPVVVGTESSNPASLTPVGQTLFFTADDGVHGRELWKTDGTFGGTSIVSDIHAGASGSSPSSLTDVNGTLYFSADDGVNGRELWKTDGTAEGTVRVLDINPAGSSSPAHLTSVDGTLFFSADDGIHGIELWLSNGSGAGTRMVADLDGTAFDSTPSELTNVDGVLFFNATDGAAGTELWTSDGTQAGTFRVADINPGIGVSTPRNLTNVNGTLFFTADDGSNGRELWALSSVAVASAVPHSLALPGGGGEYAIQVAGTDLVVFKAGDVELFRQPVNLVSSLTITGSAGQDRVTVVTALTPVETPLNFDGLDGDDFFDGRSATGPMILMGGAGNDLLFGGSGDDVLLGAAGRDVLDGGIGDDRLRGQGASGDLLTGGPGADTMDGGAGTDRIVENFPQSRNIVLTADQLNVDGEVDELRSIEQASLDGGEDGVTINTIAFAGPVTLYGGAGADRLFSGAGNDILFGLAGDDILDSGAGDDWLLGSAGRDILRGGDGDDNLRGQGSSGDRPIGGAGADRMDGGVGADVLFTDDLDTVINDVLDVLIGG